MPRFKIHHVTKYTYDGPVRDSANQVVLFPFRDEYQDVLKHDLFITGDPPVDIFKDYYGNEVGTFMHADPHTELIIDSRIEVITRARLPPADRKPAGEQWGELRLLRHQFQYIDFLKQEQFAALDEVADIVDANECHLLTPLEAAKKLTRYIYDHFKYIKGITGVETTIDEVWKLKAGVCQDFALILLVTLRMIDIPSRYVSGYVCPNKSGLRGEGATHAWIEAYIPSHGWLGLDPTNNCLVDDLHIRLAVGRNFSDCSPVKGTYKGTSSHQLEVGVSVSYEDGQTTEETTAILTPQPVANGGTENSYRRYMEMMQQQ